MANGNVRNAPGISFIEFDEKNEDKVVRWRDYLSELKAYDYIPLVKNLLKPKKVCLLGDEGCGNITPQSSLENVSSDYEEKSTVPNEISLGTVQVATDNFQTTLRQLERHMISFKLSFCCL
ncbi:unnamed protein product [Bathycoccus prasinos]